MSKSIKQYKKSYKQPFWTLSNDQAVAGIMIWISIAVSIALPIIFAIIK